jgi:hypothetical protein
MAMFAASMSLLHIANQLRGSGSKVKEDVPAQSWRRADECNRSPGNHSVAPLIQSS